MESNQWEALRTRPQYAHLGWGEELHASKLSTNHTLDEVWYPYMQLLITVWQLPPNCCRYAWSMEQTPSCHSKQLLKIKCCTCCKVSICTWPLLALPKLFGALWVKDILRSLLPKVLQLYVHVSYVFALFVDPPSLQWCSLSCVPLWPDIWQTPRLSPRRLRRPSLYDICAICYLPRKYGRSIEEHTFSELLKTRLHLELIAL